MLSVLFGMLLVSNLLASQTYWLSDIAPTKEEARKMRSSHGGMVIRGKRGYSKKLWLRKGDSIVDSTYVEQSDMPLVLVDPKISQNELAFSNKGYADVTFKMKNEGYYNLFLTDKQIKDGVLQQAVLKNESLNHSCRKGHDHVKDMVPPLYFEGTSFDIIRERLPKESFHLRMGSGDIISYKVMLNGKPVTGAAVTMSTQKGWAKTLTTDSEGRAAFQMIRDYYPSWHEFKKRNMESFLIIAEYESDESGMYQGEHYNGIHYKATAAGNYYPSTRDYKSYAYGLMIGLIGLMASIFFIYFHRKRRANQYQEKRLA
ncbi:hypothetical protein ACFL3U_05280 [Pseudomonadota bacterium]